MRDKESTGDKSFILFRANFEGSVINIVTHE